MTPQVALITGATEGIGRATAFALGRAGYRIGVCARTPANVAALVRDLAAEGIAATGAQCDVADAEAVPRMVGTITAALGPVEVLVNNAGILRVKPFEQITLEDWDATMAANVRSLFLTTREVLPGMRLRKSGTIINVSSLSGKSGFIGGSAYCASKHAVMGFSRALMLEVREDNVRVVAICPGSVDTKMIRSQDVFPVHPDRILQPDDIAATILHTLQLPARALVSEIDIRPTVP
jgi:NAD(P)-dependent dehydrogenase (short-subunit alcohol dehydrogenase family)